MNRRKILTLGTAAAATAGAFLYARKVATPGMAGMDNSAMGGMDMSGPGMGDVAGGSAQPRITQLPTGAALKGFEMAPNSSAAAIIIDLAWPIPFTCLKSLRDNFPNSFIHYKPRDIVSGDFFWFTRVKNTFVFACADCTGHGVPGAMMTMIGNEFLHQIINNAMVTGADAALKLLDKQGIRAISIQIDYPFFSQRKQQRLTIKMNENLADKRFEITLPNNIEDVDYSITWFNKDGSQKNTKGKDKYGLIFLDEMKNNQYLPNFLPAYPQFRPRMHRQHLQLTSGCV